MAIEALCSCGRLVRFDKPPVDGQGHCPDCNAVITIDNDRSIMATITDMPVSDQAPTAPSVATPGAARKPLWELMARNQIRPEFGEAPEEVSGEVSEELSGEVSGEVHGEPHGELHGELHGEPPAEPPGAMTVEADYDSLPALPATEAAGPVAGRKGLWSVMQTPGAPETPAGHVETSDKKNPEAGTVSKTIDPAGSPEPIQFESAPNPTSSSPKSEIPNPKSIPDSLATMIGITADEGLQTARSKAAGFQAENSRRAVTAAVLGSLSIPLSGLALINSAGSWMPATALGFVAILTGLIASQEVRRSGGRKTGRRQAITGIVTGIVGIFLGPVVIAPLARPRKGR